MDERINVTGKNDIIVTMNNDNGSLYLTVFVYDNISDEVATEIKDDVVTIVKDTIMRKRAS